MKKLLACLAFAMLHCGLAFAFDECQNDCTEKELVCNTTCIDGGKDHPLKCASTCSKGATVCVKTNCHTKPKPKPSSEKMDRAPVDFDLVFGDAPKPQKVCDCNFPSKGGCERHLCRQPDYLKSTTPSILGSDAQMFPSTCGFCRNNPGLGPCKAATNCVDIRPFNVVDMLKYKKTLKRQDLVDAQVELRQTSTLTDYLRNAGAITQPEYSEFKILINNDSKLLQNEFRDFYKIQDGK